METIALLIAIPLVYVPAYLAYHMFVACWRPKRARERWLLTVNAFNGRFFNFFKWTSAMLAVYFIILAIGHVALLGLMVARAVAS